MTDTAQASLIETDPIDLRRAATRVHAPYASRREYREALHEKAQALGALQRKLAAAAWNSLLVVFEGLDASGKDGAIRRVFRYCDPQSCPIHPFEKPDALEARHDFLWRYQLRLPQRGQVGVFNRSHYGDAIIPRVAPAAADSAPAPGDRAAWEGRYRSIVDWEAHLVRNGTRVLKIFLHLSADEQRRRLLKRIEEHRKSWKIERDDVCNHHRFAEYRHCYEKCIAHTHTKSAPWVIVPADDKRTARLLVADAIVAELEAMSPSFPPVGKKRARELDQMRDALLDKAVAGKVCRID
jgi:PPK2 family polyphosphate:nucleotide phosphotransferase